MINLTYENLRQRARDRFKYSPYNLPIYGIPNGGLHAALIVASVCPEVRIVEEPGLANVLVDDIVDSGATRERWLETGRCFFALVDKTKEDKEWAGQWISFPWERARREDGPQDAVRRILQYIGENPDREGLKETPDRVVKSYSELFAGYKQDPKDIMKVFEDGACDEMVVLRKIEVSSFCEHHMLPFIGEAHVGYLPRKKVIGVSKLARLVDIFAKRLQIQEKLTTQITEALDEHLNPLGSGCVIEARHMCMICRGVQKQNSVMVTSSLTNEFRKIEVRNEFFRLIGK